jgi:PAS domain S-box-containing protein/putative nucleotidyltransferase with HDIG domain
VDRTLAFRRLKEHGRIQNEEFIFRMKSGQLRSVLLSSELINLGGKPCIISIARDITERKEAADALKSSEERLKVIFEDAPDAIYLTDLKGNCLDGNKAAEDMLGYSREELIGKNLLKLKFLPKEELPKAFKNLARNVLGKRTGPDEFLLNRKNGSQIPAEISTYPVKIKGNTAVLGIARDISERKRAENELKESEVRYRMLSDLSKEGVAIHYKGIILDCNKAFCNIFGYGAGELIGTNVIPKVFTPESQEKALSNIKAGYTGSYIYRGIKKDGTLSWVEVESRNMIYNNQKVRQTTLHDVTERKEAKERLQKSETNLIEAQHMAHIGSWELDLVSNTLTWSDEVYRIFGLEPQQFDATYEAFLDNIHPDDRDMVNNAYNKSVRHRSPYSIVHRLLLEDGAVKYVNEECETFYDDSGKPIRSVGTVQDITDRKQAEEERQQSAEKLVKALQATVESMAVLVEKRDPYTAGHQRRVANIACAIAKDMNLSDHQVEGIRLAGTIHDIGKMYVPAEILSKPGLLTDIELNMIQAHSQAGYDILKGIEFPWPIAEMVVQHHERIDGSGYPKGLSGKDIIMEAKILCVSDVIEAMASHRPYRPAIGIEKALEEIKKNSGILYDSKVADSCVKLITKKKFRFD